MNPKNRRILLTIVKFLFSGGLITWMLVSLWRKGQLSAVYDEFVSTHLGLLLLAASLHMTGLLISSFRWQALLKAQGIRQPILRLFSYYLVGHFFNMFLPTRVGGDLMRIYDTSRDHGSAIQPTAVVLVERISGMLTMLLIASIVLLLKIDIGFDYLSRIPGVYLGITLFFLILVTAPFLLHPKLESVVTGLLKRLAVPRKILDIIHQIYSAFRIYVKTPGLFLTALSWGILLQLNYILHYWVLARALGLSIDFTFFLVIIPIRTVTLMFPFTINAIGLREWFDITAFGFLGIAEPTAVAFAELGWLVQIFVAVFGGVYYTFRKKHETSSTCIEKQRRNA
ncbi:MAG: lysylphosphatidylglycerol synthase transmembrane domain-containing protein [bacterium]